MTHSGDPAVLLFDWERDGLSGDDFTRIAV